MNSIIPTWGLPSEFEAAFVACAFFSGVVASYIVYRRTFLSLGGLISVGYLAGSILRPLDIIATVGSAFVAYLVAYNLVLRFVLPSARRMFEIQVVVGMCCGMLWELGIAPLIYEKSAFGFVGVVGIMVPGLISHELRRQGIMRTLVPLAATVPVVGLFSWAMIAMVAHFEPDALRLQLTLSAQDARLVFALAAVVSLIAGGVLRNLIDWRSGGYIGGGVVAFAFLDIDSLVILAITTILVVYILRGVTAVLPVFGKQRMLVAILSSGVIATSLQWADALVLERESLTLFVVLGSVIPAFIANDIFRAGWLRTTAGFAIATGASAVAVGAVS